MASGYALKAAKAASAHMHACRLRAPAPRACIPSRHAQGPCTAEGHPQSSPPSQTCCQLQPLPPVP